MIEREFSAKLLHIEVEVDAYTRAVSTPIDQPQEYK
ncbi:hypothetical protein SAMN04515679_3139 [Pelosinus fermentans]|uniref:Uncharacterized protein n=1 Tax=Pelosinus fermentans B4 TaxID=1149862 RepID=I8RIV2_9FIRM|nr:hypothetical protein FB4_0084 [Pelosinus fermentans B4]EIW21310.1 hypothetical protein FA11_1037 [Pelosinus fermentans A11]OAM94987.1 hypothetical protein FR7_03008 [Pelosinus fermentans DSM 17108]SDR21596.1 hypothetical protein SAMN04515679_3139 [Pelosinus fermentans]